MFHVLLEEVRGGSSATRSPRRNWPNRRTKLRAAARRGEGFDTETGLPESMVRTLRDVSFYEHCAEFAAATWPVSSAKTRLSVIETLDQGRARRGQRPEGRPRPGGAALG